jgi:hypothetical protein
MPYGNFKQHQAIYQTISNNYIPSLLLLLQGFYTKKPPVFRQRTPGNRRFLLSEDATTVAAGHTTGL